MLFFAQRIIVKIPFSFLLSKHLTDGTELQFPLDSLKGLIVACLVSDGCFKEGSNSSVESKKMS